jgi:hypothetical protein
VPWEELDGVSDANLFGVMGNASNASGTSTQARSFSFWVGSRRYSTLAGKLRVNWNSDTAATALAGGTVQVRVFDETGQLTKDWTTLTGSRIASDGTWSGCVTLPKNFGWGHADLRLTGNTVVHRLRSTVGVGLKLAVWG